MIGAHKSHINNKRREWRCSGTNESMIKKKNRHTLASKTIAAESNARTMACAKDCHTKEHAINSCQGKKKFVFLTNCFCNVNWPILTVTWKTKSRLLAEEFQQTCVGWNSLKQ